MSGILDARRLLAGLILVGAPSLAFAAGPDDGPLPCNSFCQRWMALGSGSSEPTASAAAPPADPIDLQPLRPFVAPQASISPKIAKDGLVGSQPPKRSATAGPSRLSTGPRVVRADAALPTRSPRRPEPTPFGELGKLDQAVAALPLPPSAPPLDPAVIAALERSAALPAPSDAAMPAPEQTSNDPTPPLSVAARDAVVGLASLPTASEQPATDAVEPPSVAAVPDEIRVPETTPAGTPAAKPTRPVQADATLVATATAIATPAALPPRMMTPPPFDVIGALLMQAPARQADAEPR